MTAVRQYGCVLKYVKEQTEEICLIAVQQSGKTLEYVKEQTEEICLTAVQQYSWVLKYVKDEKMKTNIEYYIKNPHNKIKKAFV